MISLVTITQGNPKALRRTIDNLKESFGGMVNEFIVGDVSVMDGDFDSGFEDVRMVKLPFNALFKDGFANVLNHLATYATNDLCLYLNVGEIVEKGLNSSLIAEGFNCYSFTSDKDPHIWVRMWNRRQLSWSGRIHEEIIGPRRQCPEILFTMFDTPKDEEDAFRYSVYLDVKEMVYFHQYVWLVDHPEEMGATNSGWLEYSMREIDDLRSRLEAKGARYRAFLDGDKDAYIAAAKLGSLPTEWTKP